MFGSLIIALPTEHEGGALIIRDEKNELVFESSQTCPSSEPGLDSVSWAAFWSQIEHEVAPVVSGYRVTLTFVSMLSCSLCTTPFLIDNLEFVLLKSFASHFRPCLECGTGCVASFHKLEDSS